MSDLPTRLSIVLYGSLLFEPHIPDSHTRGERTQQTACGHKTNPCPVSPQFLQANERRGFEQVVYRCPFTLQFVHVHICIDRRCDMMFVIEAETKPLTE